MNGNQASEPAYEYVVVGSGAGGAPVASNLALAGHTVLVLEAGGDAKAPDYLYDVPAFHTLASEEPSMSWRFFVRHYGEEAQQARDPKYCPEQKGVFYPRASALGGCTAHNAMIFVSPGNRDWDRIAELTGDDSWRATNMRRYFQRLERCRYRPVSRFLHHVVGWNPSRHGFDGWLTSAKADPTLAIHDRAVLKLIERAARRAVVGLANPLERLALLLRTWLDPNDWRAMQQGLEGIRLTPLTTSNGRRAGPRERLLAVQQMHPDRLTIKTGALATAVLFDDEQRAVGVEYLEGEHLYGADPASRGDATGVPRRVRATREVILACGAFNTPQLLQLSGIGPAPLLKKNGICVRVDRPGVGMNLQDRYEASVIAKMKRPFRMLEGAVMRPPNPGESPDPPLQQWIEGRRSIYTSNGAVVSILKKSSPELHDPDLLIFGLITKFAGYCPGYSKVVSESHQYFTWTILKGYSHNRAGQVAIRSKDPRHTPSIDFHYFEEGTDSAGKDLEAMVGAVEFVRGLTACYEHLVEKEELPGPAVRTPDDIRAFVRNQAWGHHASCTCKIGADNDRMAVLDSRFRVRGTRGLRVVDASIFPDIPGLFIVSAVYIAAEKASDVILSDVTPTSRREHP